MGLNERKDVVLVIDDDPEIREALEIACHMHGYQVIVAADEFEALDAMEDYSPSLVLVDYYGIADDTRKLIARLKLIDARVPIVLMSGAQDCAEKMRELGLTQHLDKPFTMEGLLKLLAKCRIKNTPSVHDPVAFSLFG
jgi:DNA-binding response OmpR family regulator